MKIRGLRDTSKLLKDYKPSLNFGCTIDFFIKRKGKKKDFVL